MDLDQELIDQITAMDDETLKKSIGSIARSMGVDPALAAMYLTDMGKIRSAVKNLNAEDLARVRESLGEETANSIIQNIRAELGNV